MLLGGSDRIPSTKFRLTLLAPDSQNWTYSTGNARSDAGTKSEFERFMASIISSFES